MWSTTKSNNEGFAATERTELRWKGIMCKVAVGRPPKRPCQLQLLLAGS
jgi:hypothetical protein